MMGLIESIGSRLREARERTGLTQEAAAASVGINRVQLSQYENGRREIDISTLARLAALYGYTIDFFLGEAEGEEQVSIAFRAEDVDEADWRIIAWAKDFVMAAEELEKILGGGHRAQ
ncbi:MAG TPA: helix-turn-helix transcriptional regulator [Firmicutes bacterium]|nr:helix-turn-helix transcriptional regulator [Bacillota bacterium]